MNTIDIPGVAIPHYHGSQARFEVDGANAALVQAGAGLDMTGRGAENVTAEERAAVAAACPRGHDFAHDVIDTFYEGLKHRPATTFGTFNDDFLAYRDPGFQRADLCTLILRAGPHPGQPLSSQGAHA